MIAAWFTPIVSSKEDSLAGERSTQFPTAEAQSIVDMVDVIPLFGQHVIVMCATPERDFVPDRCCCESMWKC